MLDGLRATAPPDNGVLSVYLDTSPGRVLGQAYLLAYRDHCKMLRGLLPAAEQEPLSRQRPNRS
jgi:hypothetical protein